VIAHGQKAKRMLAKIYDWLSKGFDLPDLRDAQKLLEELS
jgi:hypothetical protein